MADRPSPEEQVRALYDDAESRTAKAMEQLVARPAFGEVLAWSTENVLPVGKIATDTFDLVVRNLRLAGRQDVNRLARQLNRTEDKLELVLQEIENLQDELRSARSNGSSRSGSRRAKQTS